MDVDLANRPLKDWPIGSHAFVIVTPTGTNKEILKDRVDDNGQIILSGMPGHVPGTRYESLVKAEGYDKVAEAQQIFAIEPPEGQTMEQFELNVIQAFDSYKDGAERYDNFDSPGSGKHRHRCQEKQS